MSKVISFAWTTPALLAGRKTCTRRDWKPAYAAMFYEGEVVQAWDRSPRVRGARQVAWIRLMQTPVWCPLADMPDSDYEAEGFAYLWEHIWEISDKTPLGNASRERFQEWRESGQSMWVVRFKLEEVV